MCCQCGFWEWHVCVCVCVCVAAPLLVCWRALVCGREVLGHVVSGGGGGERGGRCSRCVAVTPDGWWQW